MTINNSALQKSYILSDILGETLSRKEALALIHSDREAYDLFSKIPDNEQENLLLFIQGNRGLKILSDTFFQQVLLPAGSFRRLNSLLSSILGESVRIRKIIPREGNRIVAGGSLVIMDILAELAGGTTVNVEVQRVGYLFPGERSCCYLSDLIMRQYNQVRASLGKKFSYKKLKPVILIVLMEESSDNFKKAAPHYIHRERITYDSGAEVKNLTKTIYVSLDTFHSVVHNIDTELHAWLTFLSSDSPADIVKLVNTYPEFLACYRDIVEFRRHPKELMTMYSEALAILDHNTELYMIDELEKENKALKAALEAALAEKDNALAEISRLKGQD